ncbi:hypothetical protein BDY19DRAFT_943605 [Irpex rosettiformis]|uniref:Uncharacterized protein n=1 Tax=Irpex rosettiformis TaxID=378272 RepID=A0ACB8U625_9APHY|nr:hypothetical protein BDY19DRAFT_943605 [Irpex rosettiformis]
MPKTTTHPRAPASDGAATGTPSSVAAPASRKSKEYKFQFGKYRGRTLEKTPREYLQWCIDAGQLTKWRGLRRAFEEYQTTHRHDSALWFPTLLSMEERFQAVQKKVPTWLYDACDQALDEAFHDQMKAGRSAGRVEQIERERLEALEEMAISVAPYYVPPRPPSSATLPNSKAVKELRAELAVLPKSAWKMDELFYKVDTDATGSVEGYYSRETETKFVSLTEKRQSSISACLDAVRWRHGNEVGNVAVWEVYDQVTVFLESCVLVCILNYFAIGDEEHWWYQIL